MSTRRVSPEIMMITIPPELVTVLNGFAIVAGAALVAVFVMK